MPKETVQDTAGLFDVRVGWDHVGSAQVGVETADGRSLISALYGDKDALALIGQRVGELTPLAPGATRVTSSEALAGYGRSILDVIEASQTSPGTAEYVGVWSTLDRGAINRLIRTLRRARDAAFGRDE